MKNFILIFSIVFAALLYGCSAGYLEKAGCLEFNSTTIAWFPFTCPDTYNYVFIHVDGTPVYDPSEITDIASDWGTLIRYFSPLGCCPPDKRIACLAPGNSYVIDTCVDGMTCCTDSSNNYIGCNYICN